MRRSFGDALKNAFKETTMKMCQLTNFGVSNEEMESKIEIYAKN